MIPAFLAELQKTRRSALLIVLLVSSSLPALFDVVDSLLRKTAGSGLPLQNLGLWALGAFVTLVFATVQSFSVEYQGGTIQVILATPRPEGAFLAAKLALSAAFVVASMAMALGLGFLCYALAGRMTAPAELYRRYLVAMCVAAIQFVMLVPYSALIAILCKKAFPAILVNLAVFVLLFPFGMSKQYYLVPPLIPVGHYLHSALARSAGELYGPWGPWKSWVSLGSLSGLSLGLCVALFRRA